MATAGVRVVEVDRSDRQDRRPQGKSDPLGAVSAARAAQSGRARGAPKGRDGAVEAIRALMVARRSAAGERTRAINQARALILTGPDELRARFARHTRPPLWPVSPACGPAPATSPATPSASPCASWDGARSSRLVFGVVLLPFVSPQRGDGDHAVTGLAVPAQPLMAHVRGRRAVLAVPAVIDHQHTRVVRGGRRIREQQFQPAVIDPLGIPPDSERKNCSRCTAGCCAPSAGSAPASAVSVLFRSRGASSPAR
jgi:hypothetical protein